MGQLVSDQSCLVDEVLVALGAAENVFPGVAALVLPHVAFPLEALATEGAHEGHFLRVDLHVAQQTPLVEKSFSALRTNVWPLLLMDALMRGESGLVGEALPTVAGVHSFFSVSLEVFVEVAGTAEAQVTARAFVRAIRLISILAVGLQVSYQRRLPGKCPATLPTQVLAILHVGALVLLLSHKRLEELSTDQTLVLAPGFVRVLVPLQRLFEGEPPSALRTHEGLLASVDALVSFE